MCNPLGGAVVIPFALSRVEGSQERNTGGEYPRLDDTFAKPSFLRRKHVRLRQESRGGVSQNGAVTRQ